jgi:stage II sporulation protein AA (anti-sigma F factor antagonist)
MAEPAADEGLGASITTSPGPPPTLHVRGEIDMAVSDWFSAELARQIASMPPPIVLDLRGVTFIDSSGLSVLVTIARTTSLKICGASDAARRVIELAGLSEFLQLQA